MTDDLSGAVERLSATAERVAGDYAVPEIIDYIAQCGGRCRDCADEDGICPGSGLPCDVTDERKAIKSVLQALQYGLAHGYIAISHLTTQSALIAAQEEELGRLRGALEFYRDGWVTDCDQAYDHNDNIVAVVFCEPTDELLSDEGKRARAALNPSTEKG